MLKIITTFSLKVYIEKLIQFLADRVVAPYWYIGRMTERRVRSKSQDLTLIPLIQWEVQQDDGQWRDLKAPKDPLDPWDRWSPKPFNTFTLNITIDHGK